MTATAKPIVIGHSFGGLIAQKLLSGGVAAAAIAIDPGQIKRVKPLPLAQIRSGLPVLSKPGNKKRAIALTRKQFRYGFGNAITASESGELFDRSAIRSSSTTDGAKSPTSPCPGSPARTCDARQPG